jgi:DME family drug/metabolite transporter
LKQKELINSMMVMLGAVLWGTVGTAQHFAPEGATPMSIGAARLALGGGVLLIYALLKGKLKGKDIFSRKSTYIGAVSMASFQLTFFAAVLLTGVAMGTVVAIGSAPIFAGLISLISSKENPGLKWLISTLVSVFGCVLLVVGGDELSVNTTGILLALGAGLSYAIYTASSKNLLGDFTPEAVTGVVFTMGAIITSPFLMIYSLDWLFTVRGIVVTMHLGLITTALAYFVFTYGLSGIKLHKAVTLTLAEPVTAALLGVFLLKENLSILSGVGMGLVFAGLVILSISRPKRRYPQT